MLGRRIPSCDLDSGGTENPRALSALRVWAPGCVETLHLAMSTHCGMGWLHRYSLDTPLILATLTLSLLASTCEGQINVNGIPNPFGDDDRPVYKRWWFWVIIGVVCAFAVVLAVFTIRGFRQWRRFITLEELEEKMAQELAVYNVQKDLERGGLLEGHIGGKLGLINDVARRTGVHMSLPGLQRQGSANF